MSSEDDAYATVFGMEHPGRVRTFGYGVCPSQISGSSSRSAGSSSNHQYRQSEYEEEMATMKSALANQQSEIKSLKNAMAYLMQQMGGSLPPNIPDINQVNIHYCLIF